MSPARESAVGRATGKVILLGEHAVVHGVFALALGIRRGARVQATRAPGPLALEFAHGGRRAAAGDGSLEGKAVAALAESLGMEPKGIALRAEMDIPTRAGLGSSAALACAAARALAGIADVRATDEELFRAVQASERVFHGNPSGLDATVAISGGVVLFSKATGSRNVSAEVPPLVIVHSGEAGETRGMVERFAGRLAAEPEEGRARLARIAELVTLAAHHLETGDLPALGEAMNRNHEHLSWFGMSTPALDRIVRAARSAGALGAKLTGGGGGGCAVVLTGPNREAVTERLRSAGFEPVDV